MDAGYSPILAHAERYPFLLQENQKLVERFCKLGSRIQVNAYSLAGKSNECIRSWDRCLAQNHLASYLCSGAHRLSHRPPKAAAGLAWLYQTMPRQYADTQAWGNTHRDLME